MLKPKANCRERTALSRCVVLLVALGLATTGAAAAPFDAAGNREAALLDDIALEALAAPVALYPDELLAIILPAATYPLQIVQAARFLEARQSDPARAPDDAWDDTVVALLNYPEALALLDSDLAWTERLGNAVLTQEAALMRAISQFRQRAYNAGNLQSDERQQVSRNAEVIAINAAATDTVYVPYYNPSAVILPQPEPVYHYYSNPYPLYYYPYAPQHHYLSSAFWGLTTAYTLGWATNRIRYHRHDYYSHPYYRERYFRPRYRDRPAPWPRSAFNARRHYPRNYAGDAWHSGRITARHADKRRQAIHRPARIARDRHPSDRLRNRRQAQPAAAGAGRYGATAPRNALRNERHTGPGHNSRAAQHPRQGAAGNTGFRANNGLLGNGAFARPQTRTQSRVPLPTRTRPGAANARGSVVAGKPSVPTRPQGAVKGGVPLQVRAKEFADKRRASQSRPAPVATGSATDGRRARSPERSARAQSRQGERRAERGISSRANARRNPGTIGHAYRGNAAGGRTRAGGAFLGNGKGSRSQR